jgi:hypothetical protein
LHTQVLAAILEVVGNRGGNQRLAPTANDRNAQRSIAAPESGENGTAKPADSTRTPVRSTKGINAIELQH